jgi:hypothetical protein
MGGRLGREPVDASPLAPDLEPPVVIAAVPTRPVMTLAQAAADHGRSQVPVRAEGEQGGALGEWR